jgi:hypothetical protein
MRVLWLGFPLATLLACGDDDCNREGCDAMQTRAEDAAGISRVAGVVAYLNDVVTNGCQTCGLAEDASVRAWRVTDPVITPVAAQELMATEPDASTASERGSYSLALSAGAYFVCVSDGCFNLDVVAERTTTLNVRLVFGTPQGYLAEPDAAELTEVNSL